jgi:hypothetical protein
MGAQLKRNNVVITTAQPPNTDELAKALYDASENLADLAFRVKECGLSDRWRHQALARRVRELTAVIDNMAAEQGPVFGMGGSA